MKIKRYIISYIERFHFLIGDGGVRGCFDGIYMETGQDLSQSLLGYLTMGMADTVSVCKV